MARRSRVELFEEIRRDRRLDESISIRGLAERHGVHRRTVRAALAAAVPPGRKTPARAAPVLGPVRALIDAMLVEDLDAPRKQRHTARRVRDRLIQEHGVPVSYSTVRDYVRVARARIAAEAGKALEETFVPQDHLPGREAEVDFADLWVWLGGVKVKTFLFTLRLSHSGKAVHRAYATASQEAFLDGHRFAFEQLGGVPTGPIRYDNLKAAVTKITFGRTRVENTRWVTFRSHYGFAGASRTSAVLPTPASPETSSAPASPRAAPSTRPTTAATSPARPTNGRRAAPARYVTLSSLPPQPRSAPGYRIL